MSDNPFELPGKIFRSTVERISHRFRGKVERATERMKRAETAIERAKADLAIAQREFETEMARARAQLEADLNFVRTDWAEMSPEDARSALEELKNARVELRARKAAAPRGPRGARQIRSAQEHVDRLIQRAASLPPKGGRRRRRDLDDGGMPAPVKPRPSPTPLVDGAEAPIE